MTTFPIRIDLRRNARALGATLIGLLAGGTPSALSAEEATYVVVAHKEFPVDAVTTEALDRLFRGQTKELPGALNAQPANAAVDSPSYEAFVRRIHRSTPMEMRKYWAKAVFSASAVPPRQFKSHEELLAWVASTPMGISYLPKTAVTDAVKVLRLDDAPGF